MTGPLASVIVPAHDEEAVLAATLRTLLADARPGELDVVVVANACRDRTAEVARAARVRVIETATPGKAHAIRLGDAECRAFPRFVLDADTGLTAPALRALVGALAGSGALACAPASTLDLTGVSRAARRVHRVHELLAGPRRALSGVGVYGLTEAGRDRVFPVPDVLADDGWVDRSFTGSERIVVTGVHSVVRPPRTVAGTVRRRARIRLGNRQLDAVGRPAPQGRIGLGALREPLRRREIGPLDAAWYVVAVLADRALVALRRDRPDRVSWGVDRAA